MRKKCRWKDMAVIGMYLDKVSMLAKGKYFSSCDLDAILDCLRQTERCLADIPAKESGGKGNKHDLIGALCPDGLTHEDCFCMPD